MKAKHTMKTRKKNTFLSIMLSVVLLVTLTPTIAFTPVYADSDGTSSTYKRKMQEYQAQIDELTPIYNQAVTTEANALKAMNTAKSTMDGYKKTIDEAEPTLNRKTREYIDQQINNHWPNDLKNFKSKKTSLFNYQNNVYPGGFESYWGTLKNTEPFIEGAIKVATAKENPNDYGSWNKHGPRWCSLNKKEEDALRKTFYQVLSYENVLTALDQIDECNRIRANQSELAKYWGGVKGESVPSGIKPLKVNPYLMVTSAMSVVSNNNLDYTLDHIFGCACSGAYRWTIPWSDTEGQNIHRSTGQNPATPWYGWWTRENDAKMDAHNGNIADPTYTQCGFGYLKYNPITGAGGTSQDFVGIDDSIWPGIPVSTYRNGLKAYCGNTVQAFETAKANYNSAVTTYNNAVKAYNTAKQDTELKLKRLNDAKANWALMKERYERALEREQEIANREFTVTFKARFMNPDGTTSSKPQEIITTTKVKTGGSCGYPEVPTYEGYQFVQWSSEPTNILNDRTVFASYIQTTTEETIIEEPPMEYTVTYIRSYDASVLSEITVKAGENAKAPSIDEPAGWKATGYLYCKFADRKNIQENKIIAVEYYKEGDPTETIVWHESIIKPDDYGPVTIRQTVDPGTNPGGNNPGTNPSGNNPGSNIELIEDDEPTTPQPQPTQPKPSTQAVVDLSKAGFVKKIKAQPKNGFEYNGKPITIGAYVKPYYRNNALKEVALTNYTVKYTKNNQLGIATVTFTSKDTKAFKGSIKTTFKIIPRKTPWKKIVMTKNSAQITVKAVNGSPNYQYQIRLNGKGSWKTVNSKKTTYKFTKLKNKKNYQIRVRAYKKVGNTTYYGNWNTITKKTVKKTYKFR